MPWNEFCDLLSGLNADTPLGRIVAIRLEEDRAVLDGFSPDQRRIRSQWRHRRAKRRTQAEIDSFYASMTAIFQRMSGGEGA